MLDVPDKGFRIEVYLDDGRVFEYEVDSADKMREPAAIIKDGYRHNDGCVLEHYPPWRILKVKCSGPIDTGYQDRIRGM